MSFELGGIPVSSLTIAPPLEGWETPPLPFIPHSLFPYSPIPHSPFPIPHSLLFLYPPFPIPHSLFPIPHSLSPKLIVPLQINRDRRELAMVKLDNLALDSVVGDTSDSRKEDNGHR